MPKHIVIVEDTADLRVSIVELLRMEGYSVSSAMHGEEALTLLQKINPTPNLIITDLLMPEMNGFDFIARVRKNIKWQSVPILVFTAMPPHENEEKVLEMGANSYLKKPSTLEDLVEAVKKLTTDD
jgi:DNA-binding response OmpR family regulator